MSFAFVFPGQGSQSVGMLAPLAAAEPLVQETFAEASAVLGYDLWKLCQGGPEEELGKTERTQPAMLAAGVATWRVWRKHGGGLPAAMAGHSLGEYSALVCSGALDFRTAIGLCSFAARRCRQQYPQGTARWLRSSDSKMPTSKLPVVRLRRVKSYKAPISIVPGKS